MKRTLTALLMLTPLDQMFILWSTLNRISRAGAFANCLPYRFHEHHFLPLKLGVHYPELSG
jgi:hypothetical protein